jgi:hypothetical protein
VVQYSHGEAAPLVESHSEAAPFIQIQRYGRHPLFGPLVLVAVIGVWAAVISVSVAAPHGLPRGLPGAALALGVVAATVVALLLAVARQETRVEAGGLRVRFAPLQPNGRYVPWQRLTRFAAVSYRPIRDYGGWGVRGRRGVAAYNARGSLGVLLEMNDGSSLLVGSQRALELERAIAAACGCGTAPRTTRYGVARRGRLEQ